MDFWHADRHLIENGRSDNGICHGIPWFVPYLGDMLSSNNYIIKHVLLICYHKSHQRILTIGRARTQSYSTWVIVTKFNIFNWHEKVIMWNISPYMKTVVQHTHCKIFHRVGQHGQTIRYYPHIASNRYISYKAPIETSFQIWFKSCPP